MSRWLVTGFPRSRTAWFAVLMAVAGEPCRHEASRQAQSFAELKAQWAANSGIADSALGYQLKRIVEEIKPRVLLIERDADEAKASFLRYMTGVPLRLTTLAQQAERLGECLAEMQGHALVRRIRFEALHDLNAVKWAMEWLVPGCDKSQVEDIMRLNVQVDRQHALEEAARENAGWFLG